MVTGMKRIIFLLILLSAAFPAYADTGTAALPFLKISGGARAAALAGAYTALGDDCNSVFANPAGSVYMDRRCLSFSHSIWLEDMSIENISYAQQISQHSTLLIGASALLSGDMKYYDEEGSSTGSFDSLEMSASLGISHILSKRFYVAAQAKLFSQSGDNRSDRVMGGDIGAIYRGDYVKIGFSAVNLGPKIKLGEQSFDLPRSLRAGISRKVMKNLELAVDWIDYIDSGSHFAAGGEYSLPIRDDGEQAIFLRAGYSSGRDKNAGSGISGGIGFKTTDLLADYAVMPYGDLGLAHRFSISLFFGDRRENMREVYEYHYRSREENRKQSENKLFKKGKERVADIPENQVFDEYKPLKETEKKVRDFTW